MGKGGSVKRKEEEDRVGRREREEGKEEGRGRKRPGWRVRREREKKRR